MRLGRDGNIVGANANIVGANACGALVGRVVRAKKPWSKNHR